MLLRPLAFGLRALLDLDKSRSPHAIPQRTGATWFAVTRAADRLRNFARYHNSSVFLVARQSSLTLRSVEETFFALLMKLTCSCS